MSETATIQTGAAPKPAVGRRRRRWKWLRWFLPLLLAGSLVTITIVTHEVNEPELDDRAFLNPASTAPIGAATLIERLRATGVEVIVVHGPGAALPYMYDGRTSVFVPDPVLLTNFISTLLGAHSGNRIVLAEPGAAELAALRLPVNHDSTRWATAVEEPGCVLPEAVRAGAAAVRHSSYAADPTALEADCYAHSLVAVKASGFDFTVVGTADIFRNDRIDEHGNAALALGLLSHSARLIWVDANDIPQTPEIDVTLPPLTGGSGEVPGNGVPGAGGSGEGGSGQGGSGEGGSGQGGSGQGSTGGGGQSSHNGDGRGGLSPSPFPPWLYPLIIGLALAVTAYAIYRGRRLGVPVQEPLPVLVSGAETVRGRGRLYARVRARGPALDLLRAGALTRIGARLGLAADTPSEEVVAAVAQRSGLPPERVNEVLYYGRPDDDRALAKYVADLDSIEARAIQAPAAPAAEEGENW